MVLAIATDGVLAVAGLVLLALSCRGGVWVVIAASLLAVFGLVLAVLPTYFFLQRNLETERFLNALEQLTRGRRFSKARRLCRVTRGTPVGRLAAIAFSLRLEAVVRDERTGSDYRTAARVVPFEQRAREALMPQAAFELQAARRLAVLAGVGGVACVLALWPTWPSFATLIAAAGVVVALVAWKLHRSIHRGVARALELLPAMIRPGAEMHGPDPDGDSTIAPYEALVLRVTAESGDEWIAAFASSDSVTIGSARSARLVLDDPAVAPAHAVISLTETMAVLVDLGSAAGTELDGGKIDEQPLRTGSVITIGPFRLVALTVPGPPA